MTVNELREKIKDLPGGAPVIMEYYTNDGGRVQNPAEEVHICNWAETKGRSDDDRFYEYYSEAEWGTEFLEAIRAQRLESPILKISDRVPDGILILPVNH